MCPVPFLPHHSGYQDHLMHLARTLPTNQIWTFWWIVPWWSYGEKRDEPRSWNQQTWRNLPAAIDLPTSVASDKHTFDLSGLCYPIQNCRYSSIHSQLSCSLMLFLYEWGRTVLEDSTVLIQFLIHFTCHSSCRFRVVLPPELNVWLIICSAKERHN